MVHLTASDKGPFQKEVNNHKQKNKIKMDQTFWSEDNMEILISGDRKEVANCADPKLVQSDTPWNVDHQASFSMVFPGKENWSGLQVFIPLC